MALVDSEQRSRATDPTTSFIVQAPAGSGKTEILTQRFLRLLGRVTAPEHIIALTFTRKAASEMRERIVLALQQAAAQIPASSPHQQLTLDFAAQALQANARYHWDLLQQPGRLKIITIDSLCQSINQAIPLLEQQLPYSEITDKADSFYLNAARNCIQFAIETPEYQEAIKTLLLHVDNKQERLMLLFKDMLIKREQWISPLLQARTQDKGQFEQALAYIEQHELNRFKQSIPPILAAELTRLARTVAIIENNPDSPRYCLKEWFDFNNVQAQTATALCKLLLTSDGGFRKSFDHHVGLNKKNCPTDEYNQLKAASAALLEQLKGYPLFLETLSQLNQIPAPEYNLEQWQVLQTLFSFLPLLAGHLQLLFAQENKIDFTSIAQNALSALGDDEDPTDLALYFDHAIHHLLVDEFQDTSITQFELLTKLVQGWQADEGKTLFIVGDPMQSIYRFRQAEVGLFFKAKKYGIGAVRLESLELSCNFRSSATIVDWVNQHFNYIFPQKVDIESGAVSFHPSVNVINADEYSHVSAVQFENSEAEALFLIKQLEHELLTHPEQSIGVLVRSRSHLKELIKLLRQHQIPYQGTDIDLLTHLPHLQDVWSLTQALLFPGNRLYWLSLLRSPFCGLTLNDIYIIAQCDKKKSIYSCLIQYEKLSGLSDEGLLRVSQFISVMEQALKQRYQQHLSEWVADTVHRLQGDKILDEHQRTDLEQFWNLLDRFELHGRLNDRAEFLRELQKLYSQRAMPSRLQIMTIHKSKGLEFDTVFLPGLGSQPKKPDTPLLRWFKSPTSQQQDILLFSPIHAAHNEACSLYDYLGSLEEKKAQYELQRLLYVAATRARSRLYLLNNSLKSNKSSFQYLLKQQDFIAEPALDSIIPEPELGAPKLRRLPVNLYIELPKQVKQQLNPISTHLVSSSARIIGVVTHKLLQWICEHHPATLHDVPWQLALVEFKALGFDVEEQNTALSVVKAQIEQLFIDAIGHWIISAHSNEKNEYELLVQANGQCVTRIIDRVFEEAGKLWIIDFKTGKQDVQTQTQYRQQLNDYAYYLSSRTELPIYCGLYYLHTVQWDHWQYAAQ